MFCQKCGKENFNGKALCDDCSYNEQISNVANYNQYDLIEIKTTGTSNVLSYVLFVVAVFVFLLTLIATIMMFVGAGGMSTLRSQAGNTIAEAYYHHCGDVYRGDALFVFASGLFMSSILASLGIKELKK